MGDPCVQGVGKMVNVGMVMSAAEIDIYVGTRMRRRREALGISQGRLGRHLGLTFSQIQKYEKGTNRIGAGRLYQIATFLGVQPSYFFEGLEGMEGQGRAETSLSRDDMQILADAFNGIVDGETRASVLALVRQLASDSAPRRR